jgi:hypothetical protein
MTRYQLVLQWPASDIEDYDAMIALEDSLIDGLSSDCEVDGHDAGSGQLNIFLLTADPAKAFNEVERILKDRSAWADVRVAYRALEGTDYVILWPRDLREFEVL